MTAITFGHAYDTEFEEEGHFVYAQVCDRMDGSGSDLFVAIYATAEDRAADDGLAAQSVAHVSIPLGIGAEADRKRIARMARRAARDLAALLRAWEDYS